MINLQQLKQLRKAHRYSCIQSSNLLGFSSANAYWRKEKGLTELSANELLFLATLYDCPMSELFTVAHPGSTSKEVL
ncbi:hypothetical protein BSK49_24420 [Paenibacillus odorifer]|uniref:helix-turn-helix domain-containing protein n=1 Tax=Paenibacillus odorifer TaxID=189426 RepID=UPI00096E0E81|nr:hypothetical protein [Paenibacillus odorifer]OMD83434.1 hypothetical protein BSK49_24420 [Paenibacillus odorifer]